MPRPRPPHLQKEYTRHGAVVWYVRVGSGPRTRIKGEFGSDDFMACYHAAIAGDPAPNVGEGAAKRAKISTGPRTQGYIYFARAGSYVKIGFAKDVKARLRELQVSHHERLTLLRKEKGTMQDEAMFHSRFAGLRRRGEWFLLCGDLSKYVFAESGMEIEAGNEEQIVL